MQYQNPPNDDIEAPTQPVAPPGGLWPDGPPRFSYPYSALSPDVTMVPTPVAGAIPDRYGWVQLYQVGELPGSDTRDDWGHFQEFTLDLDWKYTARLPRTPLVFSFTQEFGYRSLSGVPSPPISAGRLCIRRRSIFRRTCTTLGGISNCKPLSRGTGTWWPRSTRRSIATLFRA